MRILSQEGEGPYGAVELTIALHDCGSDLNVWSLDVVGEERVFFEVFDDADTLDIVEAAFEARRRMKEDDNG
jgi:hypothetical protein